MRQEQDNSAKKRDRRLLGLAGGAFVLALCVFGGLAHQQREAVQSASAEPTAPKPKLIGVLTPDQKAEFVEYAKMLREKWKPWAQEHKAELKRMLNASPNDEAAMLAVWDAVPINSDTVGMTPEVLMPSGNPGVGVGFGWTPLGKAKRRATTPMPRAEDADVMRQLAGPVLPKRLREFQARRDITISTGGIRTETQLWASGRITQCETRTADEYVQATLQARREGRRMTEDDYSTPAQEIVPPYDFLTNS